MSPFEINPTDIEGLFIVSPFVAHDVRGFFIKDYSLEMFQKNGLEYELKEVFYTVSYRGVIRALHFQRECQQPKLVRCIRGSVYDVVVDLRRNSKTYKKWIGFDLSDENHMELLIPGGCAHGYLVLEDSIVSYKCAEKFFSEYDDGIRWNDSDIGVKWPLNRVDGNIILAEKDENLQSFAEFTKKYGSL